MITRTSAAGAALFSDDEAYRYQLTRTWDDSARLMTWIMLNPSTADEERDDATITRCTRFAQAWGYGGMKVVNLYALRARNPARLAGHPDPVGPENDAVILRACDDRLIVAAWGARVVHPSRAHRVLQLINTHVSCLGTTSGGHPRHPLYMPAHTLPGTYWRPS